MTNQLDVVVSKVVKGAVDCCRLDRALVHRAKMRAVLVRIKLRVSSQNVFRAMIDESLRKKPTK